MSLVKRTINELKTRSIEATCAGKNFQAIKDDIYMRALERLTSRGRGSSISELSRMASPRHRVWFLFYGLFFECGF